MNDAEFERRLAELAKHAERKERVEDDAYTKFFYAYRRLFFGDLEPAIDKAIGFFEGNQNIEFSKESLTDELVLTARAFHREFVLRFAPDSKSHRVRISSSFYPADKVMAVEEIVKQDAKTLITSFIESVTRA